MTGLLMLGLIAINVAISWWNARVCGLAWEDAKHEGGMARMLLWCGVIQSAVGFSMLFIFVESLAAAMAGKPEIARALIGLWYLAIIVPALGTGLAITIHSVVEAWKQRDFASVATAAWNVGVSAHNLASAPSAMSGAFDALSSLAKSDDDDSNPLAGLMVAIVVVAVAVALAGGAMLTWLILQHYRKAVARGSGLMARR